MLEVTGHGKDEADGHGGVLKNWLVGEMRCVDLINDDDDDNVEVRLDHYLAIAYSTYLAIVYRHT